MKRSEEFDDEMPLDMAGIEGADFLLDLEQASVPNRKRFRNVAIGNDSSDAGYISFLEDLHNYVDAKYGEEAEHDSDPSYVAFLGQLKAHGNAYMCDVSVENDVMSPIIYEEGEKSSADKVIRRTARMSNSTHGRAKRKFNQGGEQRSGPKGSDSKKEMFKMDKDYEIFFDSFHTVGEHVYYVYGDQKRVYYEASNEQQTDVAVEQPGTDTRPRTSAGVIPSATISKPPTSPSTVQITKSKKRTLRDAQNMVNTSDKTYNKKLYEGEVSSYRRELYDDLRRPYDEDEYNDLYACVSERKNVNIHRDSRSGGTYRKGHLGKSYLDRYPDLNSEIEKVKSNRHKVLNLLRMFKIYVQKIPVLPPDEEKPWRVDLFKKILPGSS